MADKITELFINHIVGKSVEEIKKEIDKLHRRNLSLIRTIENPCKTEKQAAKIKQIKQEISEIYSAIVVAKLYLYERHNEAYTKRGDERAFIFRSNLPYVSEIELHISSFFSPKQPVTITFDGDKVIKTTYEWYNEGQTVLEMSKDDFLANMVDLNIGYWKKDYNPDRYGCLIEDGEQWSLTIKWSFGKEMVYTGSNAYPYNFEELCALFQVDWKR